MANQAEQPLVEMFIAELAVSSGRSYPSELKIFGLRYVYVTVLGLSFVNHRLRDAVCAAQFDVIDIIVHS